MTHNLHGLMTMETSRRKDIWPKYSLKGLSPDTHGLKKITVGQVSTEYQ